MPPRSDSRKAILMAAAEKESSEDRISALSDRAIHRVLSFLPAHEAVQTCLLSRRWREMWKSMPVLRVVESDSDSWRSSEEFNKFVNHLLFFRDLRALEEFDFTTYPCFIAGSLLQPRDPRALSVEPLRYLDMWIRYALTRNVRVLRVHVNSSYLYKHPWLFNGPLISQHLVTLELSCVVLDACSMDFSRCPLLEDLKIGDCLISAGKMSSQSIRHLHITRCEFPDDASRLQIFAPNLFALEVIENTGSTPFFGEMPLLVTAFVDLCHQPSSFGDNGDYCDLDSSIACYGSEKCVAFAGLSSATSLQLAINGCWEILKRDLKWCLPFSKLKTLVLNGWGVELAGCDVRELIFFLQLAPILEKLVLDIYDHELTFEKKIDESCSLVEHFVPSVYLKIVEVRCFKKVQSVHKLVEILIGYGIPADIITIRREDF